MAFPATPLILVVELAFGADLTADPSTWAWTDVSVYGRYTSGITINRGEQGGGELQGVTSTCNLTLDNTSGRFTPRHPSSPYYPYVRRGCPIRIRVNPGSGLNTRFTGYVDEWPLSFHESGRERHVAITASGILQRLDRDPGAALPTLVRSIAGDTDVISYWPCQDDSGSQQFSEYFGGTPGVAIGDIQFASDDTLAGSLALPTWPVSAAQFPVRPYVGTGQWTAQWVMNIPTDSATAVVMNIYTAGSEIVEYRLVIVNGAPDSFALQGYNGAGTELLADTGGNFTFYGEWRLWQVSIAQNGTSVDWTVWVIAPDGTGSGRSGTEPSVLAGTLRAIHHNSITLPDHALGHVSAYDTATPDTFVHPETMAGFAGEVARFRFERICTESKFPYKLEFLGNGDAMGPQQTATGVEVLREVEATAGLIREGKTGQLEFRTRADLSNQAAALALDFDAKHIQPGFKPVDDDQRLTNDVTASRPGGSSARFVDDASVVAQGRYPKTVDVNPATDEALPRHAQWAVNVGTAPDFRYPAIAVNFTRASGLIASWLTADIGSRITLANPPAEMGPDDVELILTGYAETITTRNWAVDLNCVSGLPFQAYQVQVSPARSRLDAQGCEVLAARTSAATSVLVSMTNDTLLERASPAWSTSAPPYDLNIAGEQVTCTAVSNAAATFIGAGTASHANNASVAPTLHASTAADDLVVVWVGIRTTSGNVVVPAGYTQLWPVDNASSHVKLLGKVAASGEPTPTVTFTGGAAGDDTSAQAATFRRAQNAIHNYVLSTNGSAQNITTPAMPTARDACIVLYLGWKQDDWTSVVSPGTAEIGEPSTITGNDQGLVWSYTIQTTAAYVAATAFTVTGGASAVSKGVVVAIPTDVQTLTLTRAVNGIAKAIVANEPVNLFRPGVVAL